MPLDKHQVLTRNNNRFHSEIINDNFKLQASRSKGLPSLEPQGFNPRRKTVSAGDVELFSEILTSTTEALQEDEAAKALTIVSANVDFLLKTNVPSLAQNLLNEIPSLRDDEAMQQGYSFIMDFLEAVVTETASLVKRNQELLRYILEAAKEGEDSLENAIKKRKNDMTSADFLVFLEAEIDNVGDQSAAGQLLSTIRLRLLEEVGDTMMTADVAILPKLLSLESDEDLKTETLKYLKILKNLAAIELFLQNLRFMKKQMDKKYSNVDPMLLKNLAKIEVIASTVAEKMQNDE